MCTSSTMTCTSLMRICTSSMRTCSSSMYVLNDDVYVLFPVLPHAPMSMVESETQSYPVDTLLLTLPSAKVTAFVCTLLMLLGVSLTVDPINHPMVVSSATSAKLIPVVSKLALCLPCRSHRPHWLILQPCPWQAHGKPADAKLQEVFIVR